MNNLIRSKLEGRKVILLGFGREGKSSYSRIRQVMPLLPVTIADAREEIRQDPLLKNDTAVSYRLGEGYLNELNDFDVIIKSPGITLKDLPYPLDKGKITSQTDLFLQIYSDRVIGITGTKGKSTTSTLIWHILKQASRDAVLLGNIGRPAFDALDEIGEKSLIVFELSSHQLEYIAKSPQIAIFLDLYPEHLDAYRSFRDYQLAKWNITKYQSEEDILIYNGDDDTIKVLVNEFSLPRRYFPFSFKKEQKNGAFVKDGFMRFAEEGQVQDIMSLRRKIHLKGDHNLMNIMAAVSACRLLDVPADEIADGVASFHGLAHRLEYAGENKGILFYDDSIATIPEACMEAVKALGTVDTLILGGFDRGVDYSGLAVFLSDSGVRNFILTGDAGKRIGNELEKYKRRDQALFPVTKFDDFVPIALGHTQPGKVCLLSPAAASYDEFMNFEVRGDRFKELVSRKAPDKEN